ncbi:ABC transporter permease [Candidatus Woesearchaeota archaeon]|nr:ABC transporter permease [Candidatus Woesearchaeota archaeon]
MNILKCLKHAFNMVIHAKLRSWLTIIGIVIGVGSVVAIMSLGSGMQASVNDQFGNLGGDILTLSAGYSRSAGWGGHFRPRDSSSANSDDDLTRTDLQVLKGISDIAYIDTNIRGNADVVYMGSDGTVSVTGVDQKVWSHVTTNEIADGRMLDSADQNVVVIGGRLASDYFDDPVLLNKLLTIEGSSFRVVGILDDTSTSIYMPLQTAYSILEDKERDVYDSIVIKVKDENNLDAMIDKIEHKLMLSRHVTEKDRDFSITSNAQINETRSEMMSSMNLFLTAIAAVSLIVGAVGVANTMFTSVIEKTKEIGIMKAIGARNSDILSIFMLNAAFIGLVGGILGVLVGTIFSTVIPMFMGSMPFARSGTLVTLDSVIIALTVSVAAGLIAGFIPAWQASKLDPVDALRYE